MKFFQVQGMDRAGKSAVDKNMSGFMRMKKVSDIWA